MTKQEEKVGTALRDFIAGVLNEAWEGRTVEFAGIRCTVFADADGNAWVRGPDGAMIGRVQLIVSPCP